MISCPGETVRPSQKKKKKKGGQWHCWLEHGGSLCFELLIRVYCIAFYCHLFCACIVTPSSIHILAATFADPNFLECLKGACICIDIILCLYCDMTLVFYCSYLQAEPNFLEHLKGACICIDIILCLY